jgi:putative membrane protein
MYWQHGDHHPPGILLLLCGVMLLAVIVGLGIWLLGRHRPSRAAGPRSAPSCSGSASGAESLLSGRFARGEIDSAEYRDRLNVLRTASPHPENPGRPSEN